MRQEFYSQQLEFVAQQNARTAEQLDLRGRGPTLDASVLVQRLINHGEVEAAATVASAAGISHRVPTGVPSSMVAYPGGRTGPAAPVYLPPLQYGAPVQAGQGHVGQGMMGQGMVGQGQMGQGQMGQGMMGLGQGQMVHGHQGQGVYAQPGVGGGPVPYAPAHALIA